MQALTQYISNNPNPDHQKLALQSGKNVLVQHVCTHVLHDLVTLLYMYIYVHFIGQDTAFAAQLNGQFVVSSQHGSGHRHQWTTA